MIAGLIQATLAQDHSMHRAERPSPLPRSTTRPDKAEEARAPVEVPQEQQGRMGLKTAKAQKKKIVHTIRTVGNITTDQTREAHVHSRIAGWIERIHADYVGKPVRKGQALFELYSPDLVSTQEEYLAARRQGSAGREIAQAALERLKLWGVPQTELDRLKRSREAARTVTFVAPVDGFIVDKNAIRGMYITPEMELYHIADLSKVWVIVTLYEYDVSTINTGDAAQIQLPYDPNQSFDGRISYIYPEIDPETRTARARIELSNTGMRLKPGMFTNVEIRKELGESVIVPDDAVIDTGVRSVVFVKTGATRFEPREVRIGPRVDGSLAILSGLRDGEQVVTGANFLIDAESKFQAALQRGESGMGSEHTGHGSHKDGK